MSRAPILSGEFVRVAEKIAEEKHMQLDDRGVHETINDMTNVELLMLIGATLSELGVKVKGGYPR